jgi:hypothetical protein
MVGETRPHQRLSTILGYVADLAQLALSSAASSIYAVELAGRDRAFATAPNLAPR